jgi:hypothetical protein
MIKLETISEKIREERKHMLQWSRVRGKGALRKMSCGKCNE